MGPGEFIDRILCNQIEAVKSALLEEPALAGARDTYIGSTPLHFAAHRGFKEIVTVLLEAGADVHALERASDTTPLHWAAEGGHPDIAKMFVERGADLEALDTWYRLPPLGWATVATCAPQFHEDKTATAAYLLEAGARLGIFPALVMVRGDAVRALASADPGALSRRLGFVAEEMQPLHFAVSRKLPEMIGLLLDLGADMAARTSRGLTSLALALQAKDAATADLLRGQGAVEDVSTAMIAGDWAAMGLRLEAGPPGTLAKELRNALLFVAAKAGLTEAILVLMKNGADVNARTKDLVGEIPSMVTPLHLAAKNGETASARLLLESGAEPSPGSQSGTPTPLHLAAGSGHLETVRVLLEGGTDVTARESGFGATPLGWAEHEGHTEVVGLLRAKCR